MTAHGDTSGSGLDQARGERDRVADPESGIDVQGTHRGEKHERGMGETSGNASPLPDDATDGKLGEDVIGPSERGVDRKCCNSNVIRPHLIIL